MEADFSPRDLSTFQAPSGLSWRRSVGTACRCSASVRPGRCCAWTGAGRGTAVAHGPWARSPPTSSSDGFQKGVERRGTVPRPARPRPTWRVSASAGSGAMPRRRSWSRHASRKRARRRTAAAEAFTAPAVTRTAGRMSSTTAAAAKRAGASGSYPRWRGHKPLDPKKLPEHHLDPLKNVTMSHLQRTQVIALACVGMQ